MVSPIQIILNPENFDEAREATGGGSGKDFFAKRDQDFVEHKEKLVGQIETVSNALLSQAQGPLGYIKVILRREAWAKSHRPTQRLFRSDVTPTVGGQDLGVLIVEASPSKLEVVKTEIAKAELQTRMRFDERRGREVPNPSRQRSETGAIEQIELYGPSDKRKFSVEQAVAWLANPATGSSYKVELFKNIPSRADWDRLTPDHRNLVESLVAGFDSIGHSMTVQALTNDKYHLPTLTVRLNAGDNRPVLRLTGTRARERRELEPFDNDAKHHAQLLDFLEQHPLVRSIELPGIIVRSAPSRPKSKSLVSGAKLPVRSEDSFYPRLGVIDGGLGPALSDWVIDRWDVLADEHIDLSHGSFIGGLTVGGAGINGPQTCPEPDGAELVDIAIFPNQNAPEAFSSYYSGGLPDFFDEMAEAVADARARHGVRVFNMSLNIREPAVPDKYSSHAARLDQIAEENNAIIVLSAGNTTEQDMRPEWPSDASTALSFLATARNDGLLLPAESARNVAVAALNPPDHGASIAFAPARFSRRGPGLRSGVKPDLAHIGGSGTVHPKDGHGLFSIDPDGSITDACGTSYSAPLVAKTAAMLDHVIEGESSRETLIGLLVHHAEVPEPLQHKSLRAVARHLVGFGMPVSTEQILETGEHSITLVFASRIQRGQQINFKFSWPTSLVDDYGRCRGSAKLTLVSTPPLDERFGAEFVRVNVNAALQQEQEAGWKGRLEPRHLPSSRGAHAIEAELIEHDLKWSPVKVFEKTFPRGVGPSSNWRVFVDYVERAGEVIPEGGVPFTAILTISDPEGEKPVFNDMRQSLQATGTQIADIRTAARIMPRT